MERARLLDTNTLDVLMDEGAASHARVRERLQELARSDSPSVFVSLVALAEKRFGFALHPDNDTATRMLDALDRLLTTYPVTVLDEDVAVAYSSLRAALFGLYAPRDQKGNRRKKRSASELIDVSSDKELGIQENDLWMAAEAVARDMILVTHDRMLRIQDAAKTANIELLVERW